MPGDAIPLFYFLDNSILQYEGEGIGYRLSKDLDDYCEENLDGSDLAAWGSIVEGVDEGDGWLRVHLEDLGDVYIPMTIEELLVVVDEEEHAKDIKIHEAMEVEPVVLELFKRFDNDGNGKIDAAEIADLLVALDFGAWPPVELRSLLKAMDKNHDGSCDYEEFLEWIFGTGKRKKMMRDRVLYVCKIDKKDLVDPRRA